ncbi:hypothetical protein BDR06DRAFT_622152 [Suillus hirtellus]|nr:hypothetical protein BDR06DRAFT_622152 [Suillus hirtellus]
MKLSALPILLFLLSMGIFDSYTATLTANLLQKPNIEDHTTLYRANVNNQQDTTEFVSKFSPKHTVRKEKLIKRRSLNLRSAMNLQM